MPMRWFVKGVVDDAGLRTRGHQRPSSCAALYIKEGHARAVGRPVGPLRESLQGRQPARSVRPGIDDPELRIFVIAGIGEEDEPFRIGRPCGRFVFTRFACARRCNFDVLITGAPRHVESARLRAGGPLDPGQALAIGGDGDAAVGDGPVGRGQDAIDYGVRLRRKGRGA
jgi:hypothetical protein